MFSSLVYNEIILKHWKKNKRLFFTYLERVDELLLEYREDIFWR